MKKILVFDMDGTLLDSMGMWKGIRKDLENSKHTINDLEPLDVRVGSMVHYTYGLVKESFEDYDTNKVFRLIHNYLENFYSQNNLAKPFVLNKLKNLYEEGYEMYVGTATDYYFANIGISSNGIDKYIKKIFTPDTLNYYKEDIRYFYEISNKLNTNPENIVFFDDAFYASELAKEAGFTVVAVNDEHIHNTERNIKVSDYFINDFSEINDNILK